MSLRNHRVVAVVEARMNSSRLPGKVLMPAGDKPLLQILCERLRRVPRIDQIVIATTVNASDDAVAALAQRIGVAFFRGSEDDVLQRVCDCLKAFNADICVEVTGDCPLVDPQIVDEMLDAFDAAPDTIYLSNSDPQRSVPAGLDVQVFAVSALLQLDLETTDVTDREHVSYGFYRPESGDRWHPRFIKHTVTRGAEKLWLSLDHSEDYELIKALHEDVVASTPDYGAAEIIRWIRAHAELHERCLHLRPEWAAS